MTDIIGKVIDVLKAKGAGFESIMIEPLRDANQRVKKNEDGQAERVLKIRAKAGQAEQLSQILDGAQMDLPIPYVVMSDTMDERDPWDYAFSLYNLEPHTLDDSQLIKAAGILGLFSDSEEIMDHLAHGFSEVEIDALEENMTFDEAVEAQQRLEDEMGIKTVVMVRCEGCDGVGHGGWHGEKGEAGIPQHCHCCSGRGVQYLPEAE